MTAAAIRARLDALTARALALPRDSRRRAKIEAQARELLHLLMREGQR